MEVPPATTPTSVAPTVPRPIQILPPEAIVSAVPATTIPPKTATSFLLSLTQFQAFLMKPYPPIIAAASSGESSA